MEHWKRRQMRLNYVWDLTGFGEEEEVSWSQKVEAFSLYLRNECMVENINLTSQETCWELYKSDIDLLI